MRYIDIKYPQKTDRLCPICNSVILKTGSKTEVEEGQLHPVTTTTYECSNEECRNETLKERELQRAKKQARIDEKARHIREMKERKK